MISRAESFALDSEYVEAVRIYDSVYFKFDFKYPKDFLVAAQVALLAKDSNRMFKFLNVAKQNQINVKRIEQIPLFDSIKKTFDWIDFFKSNENQVTSSNIDYNYCKIIDSLFALDQKLRDSDQKWYTNKYIIMRPKLKRKWQRVCSSSVKIIDSLSKIKGFPNYKNIGVDNGSNPKYSNLSLTCSRAVIIIYHMDYCFSRYGKKLIEEVKKGNLHAYHFALIRDMETRQLIRKGEKNEECSRYGFYVRWEPSPMYIYEKEFDDIEKINKNRAEIGLTSYLYERKKKTAQNIFNGQIKRNRKLIDWFYYDL